MSTADDREREDFRRRLEGLEDYYRALAALPQAALELGKRLAELREDMARAEDREVRRFEAVRADLGRIIDGQVKAAEGRIGWKGYLGIAGAFAAPISAAILAKGGP